MKKNTASQVIGVQLISKTDGSAVTTGTTTVYVTGDGGVQAAGSVGSGACTHEGQGFWTYAPAQAETNYDHVAFTFVNTNAVNATIQIYTSFPQTGDNFARLGAPAGASVSADVAAVKTQTAAIEVDTADIQSRIPAALVSGRIDASVGAMAAGVLTATAIAADAITDAKVAADVTIASVTGAVGSVTGNVGGNVTGSVGSVAAGGITAASLGADAITAAKVAADVSAEISAAVWGETVPGLYGAGTAGKAVGDNLNATISSRATQTSVDTVDDFLDTEMAAVLAAVDTEVAAIKAKTDNLPAAPAATGDIPTAAEVADKILGRSIQGGADGGRTVTSALRAIRNRKAIAAGTLTVYQEDDTTSSWTAAVTTAAGNPISEVDPA